MAVAALIIPLTMVIIGKRFMKKPPSNINCLFGYRTSMSMKNQDTWAFAHKYSGRIWFKWGIIVLVLTVTVMLALIGKNKDTIGYVGSVICLLQLVPLIGSIVPTEIALRKNFSKSGEKKT